MIVMIVMIVMIWVPSLVHCENATADGMLGSFNEAFMVWLSRSHMHSVLSRPIVNSSCACDHDDDDGNDDDDDDNDDNDDNDDT